MQQQMATLYALQCIGVISCADAVCSADMDAVN